MKELRTMRSIARQALEQADSVLFRMAGVIGSMAWPLIGQRSRPFGVEICGEPGTTRGSLRHPLRPLLHWYYTRDMRKICRAAAATAYVTAKVSAGLSSRSRCVYHELFEHRIAGLSDPAAAGRIQSANRTFHLICVGTFKIMYKAQDVLPKGWSKCGSRGAMPR